MTEIQVIKDGKLAEKHETEGFLLLYLKDDVFKATGTISLLALSPLLGKLLLSKIGGK